MRTIAMVNQKGGCGKTTTAINTAVAFAEHDKRVLLIDLDPQGHATIGLGYEPDSFNHTTYDLLVSPQGALHRVRVHTKIEGLDLVPCNVLLASAELELAGVPGKELLLSRALREARDRYDLCVIDCPPALGILTLNALVTSTDVIVPVQVHYFALEGLKRLLETVRVIRDRFHPVSMGKIGLLLTFVEERRMLSRRIQRQMRDLFGDLVFDAVIRRDLVLAESPGTGRSVLDYAPQSMGAADYRALACEVLGEKPLPRAVPLPARVRRGAQKLLVDLFDGIWIPKQARSYEPGSIEST